MTTDQYRDELDGLRDTIGSWKSCVTFEERELAAERIGRAWKRMALMNQPTRLPQRDKDRCERLLCDASALLNAWKIEVESGCAQVEPIRNEPPAKAMADTMRFCSAMKAKGAL